MGRDKQKEGRKGYQKGRIHKFRTSHSESHKFRAGILLAKITINRITLL